MGIYTPDTIQSTAWQSLPCNVSPTTIQAINLCQQGAGLCNRVGNKISMKSLRMRFALTSTGVASNITQYQRVMIIYDRQPTGSYPAVNTILSTINGSNGIVNGTWTENINPNRLDQYVVLYDHYFPLPPATSGGVSGVGPSEASSYFIDKYIKLKDLETIYNGTNATMTISLIQTGALYIACLGSAATNSADAWDLYGSVRLRYRDN